LFNLFCPFALPNLEQSILIILLSTFLFVRVWHKVLLRWSSSKVISLIRNRLFPTRECYRAFLCIGFIALATLNLFSLICYSFPITTILRFNLCLALSSWIRRIFLLLLKQSVVCSILPANSPWYLVPFLGLVELVRIRVRPVTLCFRLLANIRAGHILLTLICKLSNGLWFLGSIFGVLELVVCLVQAFVFFMLIRVYLEESIEH